MNIAVLFIATSFKERMKIGGKTLLMQSEKHKFTEFLDELSVWVENSEHKLTPVIITCFDEIYEISVEKHFKVFNNKFVNLSQWNMIRFGINSCPEFDVYFVVGSNDSRLVKSEIFEQLCIFSEKNPGKVVISEFDGVPCMPAVFAKDRIEIVRRVFDDKNGKLNIKANFDKILIMQITKETLEETVYKRHNDLNNFDQKNQMREVKGFSPSEMITGQGYPADGSDGKEKSGKSWVVVIRGGGRVASSVAFMLHKNGYKVLITERKQPLTLYRGNSFSEAVTEMYKKIDGVDAYLVAPGKQQIGKAWEANVIPVIIDTDLDCLALFDKSVKISSIYDDRLNSKVSEASDPLSYFRNLDKTAWLGNSEQISSDGYDEANDAVDIDGENLSIADTGSETSEIFDNSDYTEPNEQSTYVGNDTTGGTVNYSDVLEDDFQSKYELLAVLDLTSPNTNKATLRDSAQITVGINEYHYFYNGPDYLLSIKYGLGYGKITKNPLNSYLYENLSISQPQSDFNSSIDKKDEQVLYNDQDFICGSLNRHIYINEDGIYREIRKIGDHIEAGDIVGEITNSYNEKTSVISEVSGMLIASYRQGSLCKKGMYVAVIDSTILSKDECYSIFPLDRAIASSTVSLLTKSTKK